MPSLDLELVRHALQTARRCGFREVELSLGKDAFQATLLPGVGTNAAPESDQEPADVPLETISASAVGYYRPERPELAPGLKVSLGDKVAVIEALGIANDVESRWDGTIVDVLVEPGQAVEFGQPLASLRRS